MDRQIIERITQVRCEYTSARVILANLEHRSSGKKMVRSGHYLPAEIDCSARKGQYFTILVRDYDVRYLDRVSEKDALQHINLIHKARQGEREAQRKLNQILKALYQKLSTRFTAADLIENQYVIPYTSSGSYTPLQIGHKGATLLDLHRKGFATPDFNLLSSQTYLLKPEEREQCILDCIHNLEKLSGRKLGDPENPLLIAIRSTMPKYIPGFMPTYLNVGFTPDLLIGLPRRYGREATSRIRLNNRKTLLEALHPPSYQLMEKWLKPYLSLEENDKISASIEKIIHEIQPELLVDAMAQVQFFLGRIFQYYEGQLDVLRNFMVNETYFPSVIFQRMVCSVIDENSYAGVLYSRHPRKGTSAHLQFRRIIYGEELMTGRLRPDMVDLDNPDETKHQFPAVFHFLKRLAHLETIFRSPVIVEFTGVHGTFTILQVNEAELSGIGMLVAVINLHKTGIISTERVRELIKPYHIRQIESDAIDPASLQSLIPFCRGFSVLPRSAVSGKIYFSASQASSSRQKDKNKSIILVKDRFTPTDAIYMQKVLAIGSLNPAAIHVITTAQNLGIPAILNMKEDGVVLDQQKGCLINREKKSLKQGDWVTISSRNRTLYIGRAVFSPARLLRFMSGEKLDLSPKELSRFKKLANYYKEYRKILIDDAGLKFESLQDVGHAVRYGRFSPDQQKAAAALNRCFDINSDEMVDRLLQATLGTHLINRTGFNLLSARHQTEMLKKAVKRCMTRKISGYQAGSFIIGSLIPSPAPITFWQSFGWADIAFIISEWILHQKYLKIVHEVGEKKINLARDLILSDGLGDLDLTSGLLLEFIPLKLSRIDLHKIIKSIPDHCDSQTAALLKLLIKPYSYFYDFTQSWSMEPLRRICEQEGVPLPSPDDM